MYRRIYTQLYKVGTPDVLRPVHFTVQAAPFGLFGRNGNCHQGGGIPMPVPGCNKGNIHRLHIQHALHSGQQPHSAMHARRIPGESGCHVHSVERPHGRIGSCAHKQAHRVGKGELCQAHRRLLFSRMLLGQDIARPETFS